MLGDQALHRPGMEEEDAFGRFEDAPAEELRGGLGVGGGAEVLTRGSGCWVEGAG
jgi:hypothetical protein